MNHELTNICTNRISDYLGFDISNIFKCGDCIHIFGGAVRDSIANSEINDIDILCGPDSANNLVTFLKNIGFISVDLYGVSKLHMYHELHFISEPWTLISNNKVVQIIRPAFFRKSLKQSIYDLLSDVDISTSGVFLEEEDGIIRLKESSPHAISHCRSGIFEILKNNRMYGDKRTFMRAGKLEQKGWINLSNQFLDKSELLKLKRKSKLYGLQKPGYPYKHYNV